jgi:hypothetical protein
MRIEMMWLVVALMGACGGKKDKVGAEADEACDRLPAGQQRQDCEHEYRKRGKTTEASLNLNKIGKAAKRVFGETGKFPLEAGALLPHATGTCCGDSGGTTQVNNKCTPAPGSFTDTAGWSHLEFSVDEPSIYNYQYIPAADGTSFTAYAIGDADCDSKSATFTMTGTLTAAGNPAINITPPPIGVY